MKFLYLILFLLSNFSGSDNEPEKDGEDKDLKKALDDNLEALSKSLEEQGADDNLQELLKTEEGRKKVEEMLKSTKKKDDEEEEDDEDDDEEYMSGKGKMKKSFDDEIEEHEDVINAIPIVKSFAEIVGKLVDKFEKLEKSIKVMEDKREKQTEIMKNMGNVIAASSELIKSTNDTIESIGETPQQIPGKKGEEKVRETFLKSEDGNKITHAQIKNALIKGMEAGKINSGEITRWEISHYNINQLSADTQALVKSYVGGTN